nr:MAG TPA: hypothetical protein [Caudoviricetes sp.]
MQKKVKLLEFKLIMVILELKIIIVLLVYI